MDNIILADGTILENSYIVPSNGRLFFYCMNGMGMNEVCQIMSNPDKTALLTCPGATYSGYTDLFILQKSDGQISGGLARIE